MKRRPAPAPKPAEGQPAGTRRGMFAVVLGVTASATLAAPAAAADTPQVIDGGTP